MAQNTANLDSPSKAEAVEMRVRDLAKEKRKGLSHAYSILVYLCDLVRLLPFL